MNSNYSELNLRGTISLLFPIHYGHQNDHYVIEI